MPDPSWEDAVNLFDLERLALATLPAMARDYYSSGAHDELTLHDNRRAYERIALRPRVLVDVSARSTATRVLGHELTMPVLVAPTAFHGLAHPDAELATTRAAGAAGTVMTLSTLATTAVEDVVRAASGPVWFQLYVYRDRGATRALVERAVGAGCAALVVTVDAPRLGARERDVKNRFGLPPHLSVQNLLPSGLEALPAHAMGSGLAAYFEQLIDPAVTFADLDWLASLSPLPVLVKGIVRGDDAACAVDHGARGVVVSNHGGRQLDTAVATLDALPEVVEAVAGRAEVLIDGGVRRGTDVLKALALGARAVLVGRPVLWGLAAAGQAGVLRALEMLRAELDLAMALCGTPRIEDIGPDLIFRRVAAHTRDARDSTG